MHFSLTNKNSQKKFRKYKKALDKTLKRLYNMVYDYGTDIA